MNKDSDWVIVGRFGRPYGIKGLITVISFTDPRDNILNYTDWHMYMHHQWQPLKLLQLEMNSKHILAQVEGYQERENAARLTNIDIAITRDQLPALEEGEYYWHQLQGMHVVNKENEALGVVDEIMPTGSNDVLVVVGEKRHLIPYLPERTILHISIEERMITVDWDKDF